MSYWGAVRLPLLAAAAATALAVPAHAVIVQYDFVGHITAEDTTGPLKTLLNPNFNTDLDVVTGYVRFDASTPDTTPGVFDLPGAVFHAAYAGGTVNATGVTATVSVNRDLIVFRAAVPVAQFLPTVIDSATISLGFQTFTDGYFSLTSLPTTVPPNDKDLGFAYSAGGVDYGASTDTNIVVTAVLLPAPEPASLLLLGAGVAGIGVARRRRRARG